ncbi:MAG TPA: HEAT repeat domain-containing protein [Anaerolineae bacterium]|nr:HEAT repeat domain-containing protein [Anaerolineae bacterium]
MTEWPLLVWAVAIYAIVELTLDVVKKAPLWLLGQALSPARRFMLGELPYLRALIDDDNLKRWSRQYVTLRAIRARPLGAPAPAQPLLTVLRRFVARETQVVVLGEPGAGKTTSLEAFAYDLSSRAFKRYIATWLFFLVSVSLLTVFHSPWWAFLLLLMATPLFDRLFRRWPIPVVIELRGYGGGEVEDFLKKALAKRVGGPVLSGALRSYVGRGRLVWLMDGVNEIRGDAYDSALDGWRQCMSPGHYLAKAPVVFTSRTGENPAHRLRHLETLEILDLDDHGVRDFLRAYGSQSVARDLDTLRRHEMLGDGGLGRNPYWLKMITEKGLYTRNRGALLESFARELVERELGKSPIRPQPSVVPVDDEMEALGYLGYVMSERDEVGMTLDDAENHLIQWLDHRRYPWQPRQLLDEAEAATLVHFSVRENRAEFAHQLMQQFFAAYAVRLDPDEILARADDPRWSEVLLMVAGLVHDHLRLVSSVVGDGSDIRRLFLALGLLWGVDHPNEEAEAQVITALAQSLRRGATEEHIGAAAWLARTARDEVADVLSRLLQMEPLEVKRAAVKILAETPSRKGMHMLVDCLALDTVSDSAADALVSIGEPAVAPLITALGSWHMREAAAGTLAQIGQPALDPLIGALQVAPLRDGAVDALGKIGASAVGPLMKLLGEEGRPPSTPVLLVVAKTLDVLTAGPRTRVARVHRAVRLSAIDALVKMGTPAVEALIEALRDWDSAIRSAAALSLGQIGDPLGVEPLISVLSDKESRVRRTAVEALGAIGDTRAVEALIKALRDSNPSVRFAAAGALGQIGDSRAVTPLVGALRDSSEGVDQAAATALGRIRDDRAVEPLIRMLRSWRWSVRLAASQALGAIGDTRALRPLIAALRDEYGEVRSAASGALGQIGGEAVALLTVAFRDEDRVVRLLVTRGLGQAGQPAVEALIEGSQDVDWAVRAEVARAWGKIGDSRAVELLAEMVHDGHGEVRQRACQALGEIGDSQAVQPLSAVALHDSRWWVRRTAVEALGQLGDSRALSCLERVTERDDAGTVREAAGDAVSRIQARQPKQGDESDDTWCN